MLPTWLEPRDYSVLGFACCWFVGAVAGSRNSLWLFVPASVLFAYLVTHSQCTWSRP